METIEKFLQDILDAQNLTKEQEISLQAHKTEITNFLRDKFGNDPVIKYAGSREKGTMICDNYDLDIVCYFPSEDTRTLKEIRQDVSDHLGSKYIMEEKASAERILNLKGNSTPEGYHIDVVPGRFIEGSKDVFLHVAYGEKERMQTNLKTHIDYISNSGCVPTIRLIKIWAKRNNIHLKTFVLEMFVVESLSGYHNKAKLKESFLYTLECFKDKFATIQLVDPANTNNIVTKTVSQTDKSIAANTAKDSFNLINGSDELSDWKKVFNEEKINSSAGKIITGPTIISNPPGQWAY